MAQLLQTFGPLITLLFTAIPVILSVWWTLGQRRADRNAKSPMYTAALDVTLVVATLCVLYVVAKPVPGQPTMTDLVPGTQISEAITALPRTDRPLWQAVSNVLLLAPLGALTPLRVAPLRSMSGVLGIALLVSTGIELAQYCLLVGRVAAIDDVILNTAGAGMAAWLTRRGWDSGTVPRHARTSAPSVRLRSPDLGFAPDVRAANFRAAIATGAGAIPRDNAHPRGITST